MEYQLNDDQKNDQKTGQAPEAVLLPDGLWPVMLTPFTEEKKVDYPGLEALTRWYLEHGAAGLFAVCLSNEMELLTEEERLTISSCVKKAAGEIPVASTAYVEVEEGGKSGGGSGDALQELIDSVYRMSATGVDIVVLLTNSLAGRTESEEQVRTAIERILKEAPEVPFGLYECPKPYKRLFSPELVKWCARTGRFVFYKETSLNPDI